MAGGRRRPKINGADVRTLVVACAGGTCTSPMLAHQIAMALAGTDVVVTFAPASEIPSTADVVVTHECFVPTARASAPGRPVIGYQYALGDPAILGLIDAIRAGEPIGNQP